MIKLTNEEAQLKINEVNLEIVLLEYTSYNKIKVKTKYGVCLTSLNNIIKFGNTSIKTAIDKTEYFKNVMLERFPNYESKFKIIGKWERSSKPLLVEDELGLYLIKPDTLLQGALPHLKSAVNKTEYSINFFNRLHNNKYEYPDYEFCGSSCIIQIKCPKHGIFPQKDYIHRMKSGCPHCADEKRVSGYRKSDFVRIAKNRICKLYLLKIYDENETFFKIGITARNVKKRYSCKKDLPYNYEIVSIFESENPESIYDMELEFKQKYKEFKYQPNRVFAGSLSECFNLKLPLEEIKGKYFAT